VQIDFRSSERSSLGVEVELEIVDQATGELHSAASEVLPVLGRDHPNGEHPKAKHELLECTVEIITGICSTVEEARADLAGTLAELTPLIEQRGLALMCSGSHPFSDPSKQDISPNPRYHQLVEDMQWMARRMQIFGIHVHVGVRSPEKAVAMVNALCGYIPHFLAGLPTLGEVAAMAAMSQCLVERLNTLIDRGYTLPVPRSWIIRENKWRAARYGLEAEIILDDQGRLQPVREAIEELVDELTPVAKRLGCSEELRNALAIMERGPSYIRQREVVAAGGTLTDVVDSLVTELRTDRLTPTPKPAIS
jgi:gamma-glutamyl:cysteine ligase YbdK (ATP-grasp superfamily)